MVGCGEKQRELIVLLLLITIKVKTLTIKQVQHLVNNFVENDCLKNVFSLELKRMMKSATLNAIKKENEKTCVISLVIGKFLKRVIFIKQPERAYFRHWESINEDEKKIGNVIIRAIKKMFQMPNNGNWTCNLAHMLKIKMLNRPVRLSKRGLFPRKCL